MKTITLTKQDKAFTLRPYSQKELAAFYGLTKHTIRLWLRAIEHITGKPIGRLYSVKQVQQIIEHYGIPGQVVNEAA